MKAQPERLRSQAQGRIESASVPELVLEPEERPAPTSPEEPIRAGRDTGTGRWWVAIRRVGRFVFAPADDRVHGHPEPRASPAIVRAAYLATALPLALRAAGHHLLHASAVETSTGGVVAFCGRSGAGKSTLAQALARRGFTGWADDAVWFEIEREGGERPAVRTRRLPFEPRLRPDVAERLGAGRPAQEPAPKSLAPRRTVAPLAAVYLLERRVELERATFDRLALTRAFPTLLDNAYHLPAAGAPLDALAATCLDLATAVPTFHLSLPDDLDRLDWTVDALSRRLDPHGERRTA